MKPQRYSYGRHPSQFCELFLPREGNGAQPLPVVALLHGGFWRERYGRWLEWPIANDLCRLGFAVWNVEYRRLGGDGGWPATLIDVAAAIDFLASVAHPDVELDLGNVTAIGHSAGGQLALWCAARPSLPSDALSQSTHGSESNGARFDQPEGQQIVIPSRAVAQSGVLDLVQAQALNLSNGVVAEFLGGTWAEVPDRYQLASPTLRLPIGVELLITHGGKDRVVPAEMSEQFASQAIAAGDSCDLYIDPAAGHFEHIQPTSQLWSAVVKWLR